MAGFVLVEAVLPEGQIGFIGDRGELPNKRRYNGDQFEVPDNQVSEKWMKVIKRKPGPKSKDATE